MIDTKSAAGNFPTTIDLHNAAVMIGNSWDGVGVGGTWSGTITITYDTLDLAGITTFGLPGNPAVISGTNIVWTVPNGTNVTALAPTYTLTSGTCTKASGSTQNFSTPQTYSVTDGTLTHVYTVTVVVDTPFVELNVNLDTATRSGLVGPAAGAGATWNQQLGVAGLTKTGLSSASGTATLAGFTCSAGNVSAWGAPTLKMLSGGAYQTDWFSSSTLVINGLSRNRKYALFIASFHPNLLGGRSLFATPNVTGTSGTQIADNGGANGNSNTWVRGVNYVRFDNIEADAANRITITMTADSGTNDKRAYLSGFQLLDSAPPTPTGLSATPGVAQIALTWSASAGAAGYTVKRSQTSGAGYASIGTVSDASFTDTTAVYGTPYYYVVSASNVMGESADCAQVGSTTVASAAKDMLTFGPGAVISGTNISWTLAPGTAVTNLAPVLTVSAGATCNPASGVARNFSSAQTYTVAAQNGSTQVYTVTATVTPTTAVTFAVTPMNVSASGIGAEILNTGTLIEANHVGAGGETPVTLANGLVFGISTAHLINPDGGDQEVLPVSSRTTGWRHNASDNRAYAIGNAAFDSLMDHAWWIAYTDSRSDMVIGGLVVGHTYRLQLISEAPNDGTVAVEGRPEFTWSGNNSVLSATWTAVDTTLNMQYSRKQQASPGGQGNEVYFQGYALHDITSLSPQKNFTSFTFPGLGNATIAGTNISLSVPTGTVVTALAPTYVLAAGATCAPASGTPRDFTNPQTYTVTAQNGSTIVYTVAVQPSVTLGLSGSPLAESSGVATVTATLSAKHWKNVTVYLAFTGTATLTTDYRPSATSIVIPAGATSGSITLTAVPNTSYAFPEKTIVTDIASVTNGTAIDPRQVTAVITEDDPVPLFPLSGGQHDMVACRDNPAVKYDIYLPPNYSPDGTPLPILYTFNPGGGGLVADFLAVSSALQIITVGIINSSNDGTWEQVMQDVYAVTRDIRQRVLFDPTAEMAAGFSGGGETCYYFSRVRGPQMAGIFPMAGWLGVTNYNYTTNDRVPRGLLVARSTGTSDSGANYYLNGDGTFLTNTCGAVLKDWSFDGGHSVAPDDVKTSALTWILNNRVKAGANDRAAALVLAASWRARIGSGERQAVLGEAVSALMTQPRTWVGHQAQLLLDEMTEDATFRRLDMTNLAQGNLAREYYYETALGAALNGDWVNYRVAMKVLTGITGANGYRSSDIYNLVQQYGYPTPELKISQSAGQLFFSVNKDTPGLLYMLQSSPDLSAGSWQDVLSPAVQTNTTWSVTFPVPTDARKGFFRIFTLSSAGAVP